ncbi:uncharacterized protein LOC125653571 [Ostrea edulis]|uniref:uncharacterized protein LOC125653571 n=1 Tax=Ostrea edulis TaxID=37623 RepID=UPI0020965441|nr:uncharacterized protein LOC125653571 [Ostrea edulis]
MSHSVDKKCAASIKPRTVIGTVTINRNAGETVTLKSTLHCINTKPPNRIQQTPNPAGTLSRPQHAVSKVQKAKGTNTHQNIDSNHVVQATMERKLQLLEDVRLANGARLTQKEQIPFWLIKGMLEPNKTNPEENHAVPQQPTSLLAPSLKQGAHPLPTKSIVPHPPYKDSAHYPLMNTNVPYQLPKLGVPHPLAKSNVPYQPPKPCVQQTSSKPCPPAISKPAVQQQRRRLIFLKEEKKRMIKN